MEAQVGAEAPGGGSESAEAPQKDAWGGLAEENALGTGDEEHAL